MLAFVLAILLAASQPPDPAEAERLEREQEEAADRAERAQGQADAAAQEIAILQRQLVELGARVGASEANALATEGELGRLAGEEAEILARLADDREALIDVLAAIQRIESQTPPALLASPDDAADAARAAAIMADIAPALRDRAEALTVELDALRRVRSQIEAQRSTLAETETTLSRQRLELEVLIAERRSLEARRRDEAVELLATAETAGREARSIRSLLGELARMAEVSPTISPRRQPADDADIPTPRPRPARELVAARAPAAPIETLRFADARGQLRPPATGTIVSGFGDVTEDGTASEGIFIRTRARSQVISPFDARVEYAGPFNTYGGLLILNVGDDYYIVLAGMSVTYASAGQSVLAGEPVGAMPDDPGTAPDLYLELRRDGIAIDPAPWLSPVVQSG